MDWRNLRAHGVERGPAFFRTALEYAQYLWQRGRPARAILCLDRAFGADVPDAASADGAPPPYAALAWMLVHVPTDAFIGNPRVHFQHLAVRMSGPRIDRRRWRAWACWAIAHRVLPGFPGDPKLQAAEPTLDRIGEQLAVHGQPMEHQLWHRVLTECGPRAGS